MKRKAREIDETKRRRILYSNVEELKNLREEKEEYVRSYKDSLLGNEDEDKDKDLEETKDWMDNNGNDSATNEEEGETEEEGFFFEPDPSGDTSCTIIRVTEKERKWLIKPFEKSVIIKLLGKSIGYKFLEKELHQL